MLAVAAAAAAAAAAASTSGASRTLGMLVAMTPETAILMSARLHTSSLPKSSQGRRGVRLAAHRLGGHERGDGENHCGPNDAGCQLEIGVETAKAKYAARIVCSGLDSRW